MLVRLLAVAVLAPAAWARPVTLPVDGDSLAEAGSGGHVVVAQSAASGASAIAIRHLDATTRTDQVLYEIPTSGKPFVQLVANRAGYLLVALRFRADTVIRDLATGAERSRQENEPDDGAFAADGTLVTAAPSEGVVAWRPDGTFKLLAQREFTSIAVAGGRVVFSDFLDQFIAGLDGGAVHRLRTPRGGRPSLIGFDGTTAAFATSSCRGARPQVTPSSVGAARTCSIRAG